MRVADAFLANSAEVHNGLVYVLGGFPEWWTVPTLPLAVTLSMVVVAELEEPDLEKRFELSVQLLHPTSERAVLGVIEIFRERAQTPTPGTPIKAMAAASLQVPFLAEGVHLFTISHGEERVGVVPLVLKLQPSRGDPEN